MTDLKPFTRLELRALHMKKRSAVSGVEIDRLIDMARGCLTYQDRLHEVANIAANARTAFVRFDNDRRLGLMHAEAGVGSVLAAARDLVKWADEGTQYSERGAGDA